MPDRPTAHVVFPLEQDEDGWPPYGSERLWAYDLGDGLYRLDSTPWFVRGIATGDVVAATVAGPDENPVFDHRVEWSGHLTIRVICFRAGPLAGEAQAVLDALAPLGVTGEGNGQGLVAIDIAPGTAYEPIFRRLTEGIDDGSWEFEEGCVDEAWRVLHEPPPQPRARRGLLRARGRSRPVG